MSTSNAHYLPPALAAARDTMVTPSAGTVSYYGDTRVDGRPLLLLHSINAAPSAMEIKPLFDHYRQFRPVYAPDLPGFGFSDRADLEYSPDLYASALLEFIAGLDLPAVDVVALSTSAEFAARAAIAEPQRFHSLVLVSPTGLGNRAPPKQPTKDRMHRIFRSPLLGPGLYRLLTTKVSIRFFLNLAFEGKPPAELIDYAYATAHQPGALYAPYCFLSGKLFTREACSSLYENLSMPALILYDKDPNISFEKLPRLLQKNPRCAARRIAPTRGLPHWEQLEKTVAALEDFWPVESTEGA
jgi:pimeloyl-ACP methyl ester carboxylesterase